MAKPDVGATADRLFNGFIAPLVIGGAMTPGRPIGARIALAIGGDRPTTDIDRAAHTQLARVRAARKLVAVDRFEALSRWEWALLAALHDLVQTTHPDLKGTFRSRAPLKLLELAEKTLEHVPPPASAQEALSRHTLLGRMFEITRTDTVVSWWVGSSTFLGTDPPPRLTAWPELRRVNIAHTPRPLMTLTEAGAGIQADRFESAIRMVLSRSPLTDLATASRVTPRFAWCGETLGLVASRAGRTLGVRALAGQPDLRVDDELGRATKALMVQQLWKPAAIALDLLGERSLTWAEGVISRTDELPVLPAQGDGAFARAAGSFVARRWIAMHGACFAKGERFDLLRALEPAAGTSAAKELEELLKIATASAPAPS
jgi:hypothetical protein